MLISHLTVQYPSVQSRALKMNRQMVQIWFRLRMETRDNRNSCCRQSREKRGVLESLAVLWLHGLVERCNQLWTAKYKLDLHSCIPLCILITTLRAAKPCFNFQLNRNNVNLIYTCTRSNAGFSRLPDLMDSPGQVQMSSAFYSASLS